MLFLLSPVVHKASGARMWALQGNRGHICICAEAAAAQLLGYSEGGVCNAPLLLEFKFLFISCWF